MLCPPAWAANQPRSLTLSVITLSGRTGRGARCSCWMPGDGCLMRRTRSSGRNRLIPVMAAVPGHARWAHLTATRRPTGAGSSVTVASISHWLRHSPPWQWWRCQTWITSPACSRSDGTGSLGIIPPNAMPPLTDHFQNVLLRGSVTAPASGGGPYLSGAPVHGGLDRGSTRQETCHGLNRHRAPRRYIPIGSCRVAGGVRLSGAG